MSALLYWTGPKIVRRLSCASHKRRDCAGSTSLHAHPAHELLIVDHGNVFVSFEGQRYELGPGECVYIPVQTKHRVEFDERGATFFNIMYRGRAFPELEKHVIYPDREALDILVKIKEYARPPAHPYRSELAAAFLAAFLIRLCLGDSSGAEAPRLLPSNTVFYRSEVTRRAAEYIERNHTKKLTLKEVSEQVGISASYLRSLLLRETGAGFSVHLARARVEAAKKLLKTSFGSIKTIAPDCGFQSLPLFFKLFKRHAGMTPLEYAKSFGDADE